MDESHFTRPLLSPWHRRARTADALLLGYGSSLTEVSGAAVDALLPALLPRLDGRSCVDEIVAALGEPSRPAVEAALSALGRAGLLAEGPPVPERPLAMHLASLSARPEPERVAAKLAGSCVGVVGSGTTAEAIVAALTTCGIDAVRDGFAAACEAALTVVAPAPAELPQLHDWNREALDTAADWLVVLPFDGGTAWVGPLFDPPETCCFECFRLRRAANLPHEEAQLRLDEGPASYPVPPVIDSLLASFTALAVARKLGLGDPLLAGAAYAFELGPEPGWSRHVVYPVPRCPACAVVAHASPVAVWGQA